MSKIEAVIFDWAGTTVDYGCFAPVKAFGEVFSRFGMEVTMEEVRKPMGMLKWDHIKTMLEMPRIHGLWLEKYGREPEDKDVDRMYEEFEPGLLSILPQYTDIKPYVRETVKELRDKGIRIGSTTGYTDVMMEIVVREAAGKDYAPDCWYSPDAVGSKGRPYPYMIFKNMETLGVTGVDRVIKVGDTISDIKEGVNAGVKTIGVLEGSSLLGLSEAEFAALSKEEKKKALDAAAKEYLDAGAAGVVDDIRGILAYI